MNYHICIQDKFLAPYIEDVYTIGEENNNEFWFRGLPGDSDVFSTERSVKYIGSEKGEVSKLLKNVNQSDRIFVHWYDEWIAALLLEIPNRIYVYHWGGEFFTKPYGIQMKWLFDTKTLNYVKNTKNLNLIWRWNVIEMYKQLVYIKKFHQKAKVDYVIRHKQIEKIDYIIMTEGHDSDIAKTKALFPNFKAKYLYSFYNSNFSEAITLAKKKMDRSSINLLLGNSADPTNNHLDALENLQNLENITIYCPLSYGNKVYREIVIKKGKEMFAENFIPITEFMSRDKYINFLNKMDVVFMFHNRSQAWGNILTSLTLGKPVFMKKNNSLFSSIQRLKLPVFDVGTINKSEIEKAILKMEKERGFVGERLEPFYSENVRLKNLKKVLN